MEAPEEVIIMGPSNPNNMQQDHTQILKRKRTKRQRPQSPIPFHTLSPAATSSADGFSTTPVEEEEDMANCLILLAQGRSRMASSRSSRRPFEDAAPGKVGSYVYECRTCSRTFPSFQALGGHRASHKKPKVAAATLERRHHFAVSDEEEGRQFKSINNPLPLSLQLSSHHNDDNSRSNMPHECAICGAEFISGQALGGHMRRHRGPASAATAADDTTLSLSPMVVVLEAEQANDKTSQARRGGGGGGGGEFFSLDLNLPATPEDEHPTQEASEHKQEQEKEQQQQKQEKQSHLVFSTPLVDCHY